MPSSGSAKNKKDQSRPGSVDSSVFAELRVSPSGSGTPEPFDGGLDLEQLKMPPDSDDEKPKAAAKSGPKSGKKSSRSRAFGSAKSPVAPPAPKPTHTPLEAADQSSSDDDSLYKFSAAGPHVQDIESDDEHPAPPPNKPPQPLTHPPPNPQLHSLTKLPPPPTFVDSDYDSQPNSVRNTTPLPQTHHRDKPGIVPPLAHGYAVAIPATSDSRCSSEMELLTQDIKQDNYFCLALLATLLLGPFCGTAALCLSNQSAGAAERGDWRLARRKAMWSVACSTLSLTLTVVFVTAVGLYAYYALNGSPLFGIPG